VVGRGGGGVACLGAVVVDPVVVRVVGEGLLDRGNGSGNVGLRHEADFVVRRHGDGVVWAGRAAGDAVRRCGSGVLGMELLMLWI